MRKCLLFTFLLTVTAASGAFSAAKDDHPKPIPKEFSYTYMIEGQLVGKSSTKTTETADRLVFDSKTDVAFGEYKFDMATHTEADKKTYRILKFTYEGSKGGMMIGGESTVTPDSVVGFMMENGSTFPGQVDLANDQIVMFEDYIAVHQVLLARAYFEKGIELWNTDMFLPSTFQVKDVAMGTFADAYLESDYDEAVVSKLQVQMQGAHQYIIFYDKKRGMPLYLAFPGVNTEVFLDEFYGDMPVSRYRLPSVKE